MALSRLLLPALLPVLLLCAGCATARIGSVHAADRGVLVADAEAPIVAVVTERGVTKHTGNSIVRMNSKGRWAVVSETKTGPRWVPWKRDDPQGAGLILTLPDVTFTAIDLDTGQTLAIPHGFNADDREIREACLDGDSLLIEVGVRFHARPPEHHAAHLPDREWKPIAPKRWADARKAARSEVKSAQRFSSSVELGTWGRLVQVEKPMNRQIVLAREGKPDLIVLKQHDTADGGRPAVAKSQ